MKPLLQLAFVGSTLILFASACGSRKQYGHDNPPVNPERIQTSLVSPIPLAEPDNTAATNPIDPTSALTPVEVERIVSRWHKAPVVWNKSAGEIELGKTDYKPWENRFQELQRAANFQVGVAPTDANFKTEKGLAIPTTVMGVIVTQIYEGTFELPTEKGEIKPIRMGESFVVNGFFQASADKKDIESEKTATRGRKFFKNLYNSFVKVDEGGDDFDCFTARICKYQLVGAYFVMKYESPRNEKGEIWVSTKNNIFVQANFSRPDIQLAGELFASDINFDVIQGRFVKTGSEPTVILNVGATYEQFKAVKPDESTWFPQTSLNYQTFLGLQLGFQKLNDARLTDIEYSAAEPGDSLVYLLLDKNYLHQVSRQRSVQVGSKKYNFYKEDRSNLSKAELIAELTGFKGDLESEIKSAGGQVLQSYINNRFNNRTFSVSDNERYNTEYSLRVIYRLKGTTRDILLVNKLQESSVSLQYSVLNQVEESFLALAQAQEQERTGQFAEFALGELAVGRPVVLSEMDSVRNEAVLNLASGAKLKVSIDPYVTLYRKLLNAAGVVSTEDLSVSTFRVANTLVYFKAASECGIYPLSDPSQFCVVGLSSSAFVDNATLNKYSSLNAAKAELRGQLQVCGKTLKLGMTRIDFHKALSDIQDCPIASLESQSSRVEKYVYYLPKANVAVEFLSDDGNTLSAFLFY